MKGKKPALLAIKFAVPSNVKKRRLKI